jgi:hypothetical protein
MVVVFGTRLAAGAATAPAVTVFFIWAMTFKPESGSRDSRASGSENFLIINLR